MPVGEALGLIFMAAENGSSSLGDVLEVICSESCMRIVQGSCSWESLWTYLSSVSVVTDDKIHL